MDQKTVQERVDQGVDKNIMEDKPRLEFVASSLKDHGLEML